jgi:hypothetical protein
MLMSGLLGQMMTGFGFGNRLEHARALVARFRCFQSGMAFDQRAARGV